MEALNKQEIHARIDKIKNIVEMYVHPVVSPDNWYIYSDLHDELEQLELLLEQNNVI